MPLFFVVGGFASLTAWHSLRRRGGTGAEYVRKRILRLAQPALPLYVFYVVVLLILRFIGVDQSSSTIRSAVPARRSGSSPHTRWCNPSCRSWPACTSGRHG